MNKQDKAKAKEKQTRVEKFYEWLEKTGNVYMADVERMDRAILIISDNV
jgi:hypothetical protein